MRPVDIKLIDELVLDLTNAVYITGLKRVVIGMSGGIDSALACNLAVLALGKENVSAYSLPYKASSQASRDDALLMAVHLGINLEIFDISQMAEAYPGFSSLSKHRMGNILARLRMIVLFDKSAEQNALVIGTGNKSEIMLGYMTWFGDSACAVNPLGDMYKTQVYQASRLLGIPEKLITKAPSADLSPGQTDEKDFGYTYAEIDKFLNALIECGSAQSELTAVFGDELVQSITDRITHNSYKRELPKILSIGQKSIINLI